MRIKEITYQSRRDFKAIFKCGKTENSDYIPRQTKYSENMEI